MWPTLSDTSSETSTRAWAREARIWVRFKGTHRRSCEDAGSDPLQDLSHVSFRQARYLIVLHRFPEGDVGYPIILRLEEQLAASLPHHRRYSTSLERDLQQAQRPFCREGLMTLKQHRPPSRGCLPNTESIDTPARTQKCRANTRSMGMVDHGVHTSRILPPNSAHEVYTCFRIWSSCCFLLCKPFLSNCDLLQRRDLLCLHFL